MIEHHIHPSNRFLPKFFCIKGTTLCETKKIPAAWLLSLSNFKVCLVTRTLQTFTGKRIFKQDCMRTTSEWIFLAFWATKSLPLQHESWIIRKWMSIAVSQWNSIYGHYNYISHNFSFYKVLFLLWCFSTIWKIADHS